MFERLSRLFHPAAGRFDRPFVRTIQNGLRRMAPEAVSALRNEVESAQTENGLFRGRTGPGDLYYTFFALPLARLVRARIDRSACRDAVAAIPLSTLDVVHTIAALRLLRMVRLPVRAEMLRALLNLPATSYPQGDPDAPYARFLLTAAFRDFGLDDPPANLADYRIGRGGYANVKGETAPAVNATAAALFLLTGDARQAAALTLQNLQDEDGSFKAMSSAPQGDLLSTATASFALHVHGYALRHTVKPFLRACFRDTGLFAATPDDPVGDLEYTAYGLLTMGLTT